MKKRQALSIHKLFVLLLSFLMMFGIVAPNMEAFAVEKTTTDFNLANLNLYEFKCRQENMQVISSGSGTLKEVVTPNGAWTKSTVFMHKYAKSNSQQNYDNVLELLFTNSGEVNGKKVNVRVKVSHLQLNPTRYYGQQANFNDANAGVPFLTVDQNWGDSGIQLMDYVYPDHPNFTNDNTWSFNTKTDVTATLEYADGTPCDLKLTMQPSDIDVKPGNPAPGTIGPSFYEEIGVKNLDSTIDKIVYNRAVSLDEENGAGNWHWWKANANITAAGTSGQDEYNKTGFVMRSKTNSITFAYNSSATSGGLFKFFAEVPYHNNPGTAAKKTVDKTEAPKRVGEPINYTVRYTVPRPGTDIIDDIKSLKFADTFDKKVDFKEAVIKFDGNTLVEGQDYRVTVKPDNENDQDYVEINIINNALFARDKGGKVYEITYKTETNSRALVEGDNTITNSAAKMYFDNVPVNTNTVKTKLLPPTKPKKDVFKDDMSTSVDGKAVKGGDVLTYKVTYKNTLGKKDDVTIADSIPKHTTYVAGSADNGGVENNGVITWKKKDLGNNETFTVTFKVKVDKDVDGKPIDNQAKVSTNDYKFDTNKTHNPTPTEPKKEVFKFGSTTNIDGKTVAPGQRLTYAITYKNTTGESRDVTITDKLPKHTSFVEADNNGVFASGQVVWTKRVADGETFKVTFTIKVNDDADGITIPNKANVNDGFNDSDTNLVKNQTPKKMMLIKRTPKTGDDNGILIYGVVLASSLTAAFAVSRKRRKSEK